MAILYVTIQGHTYSTGTTDEGTGIRFLDAGGHWDHLLPLIEDIVVTASEVAANVGEIASSTTSLAIGTGSKTFTTQPGIPGFLTGNWVRITSAANENNYMIGQITSYSSTTLVIDVVNIGGSGTHADWGIRLTGFRGADGAPGPAGDSTTFTTSVQVATAGQTTFNITYPVGYIEVFQNGVKLTPNEFTASNGTTVVLETAASLSDELMFVVYTVLSMGEALVPTDIGVTVQEQLISGSNLKTVNSISLLGSGDVPLYSKAKTLFLAWS